MGLDVLRFGDNMRLCQFYSFVWVGAGKQPDLEKHVGVGGYGYPAMVALNVKKGVYAPLKSAFQRQPIT